MKQDTKKSLVIHPFLFAIFPILSIFSHNVGELYLSAIVTPIIMVICFALVMFVILGLIIKDRNKTGIIVSLFLLLFFSYGLLFYSAYSIIGERVTHGYVLVVCGIVLISGVYSTIKTHRNLRRLTIVLNLVAAFLVAMPAVRIAAFEAQHWLASRDDEGVETQSSAPDSDKSDKLPSIYYIILDGYARADILKDVYQYDNSEFLEYLTQKGFYVANKSKANYCFTFLSLAASLNLTYLDDLVNRIGEKTRSKRLVLEMVKNNKVASFLKQFGYLFVVFSYHDIDWKNADFHMTPGLCLSDLQNALISGTPLSFLLEQLPTKSQYDLRREEILYILGSLPDMAEIDSPTFVFAHIIAPHPPFVFGENGEPIQPNRPFTGADGSDFVAVGGTVEEYIENYRGQLVYINKKVKETIDRIISTSPEPPIIILQSDHGPASNLDWKNKNNTDLSFKERMSILNAYYLPDNGHKHLYDEISPVNTFRIIFNHYFGTVYELLKDKSYFSTMRQPYKFINVTDRVVGSVVIDSVAVDSTVVDSTIVPEPTE